MRDLMVAGVNTVDFDALGAPQIDFLDRGGVLHIQNNWASHLFLDSLRGAMARGGVSGAEFDGLFGDREVESLATLGLATRILKLYVHNHLFAMAMLPLIERIGCEMPLTHVDCGVLRCQLLGGLRDQAMKSKHFAPEDFVRTDPRAIPEVFGSQRLPPHRDVRWPHIRLMGFWMTLTDLQEQESVTLFPEVFKEQVALGNPAIEPFPPHDDPMRFGLGVPLCPSMKAGDVLVFHAATVHSSPARQTSTLRASIDWRIAYPCLDDFGHYKWTFIQANNLRHRRDDGPAIDRRLQAEAFMSFGRRLIDKIDQGSVAHEAATPLTMWEWRFATAQKGALSVEEIDQILSEPNFCPDTMLWAAKLPSVGMGLRSKILASFLQRSNSYWWLYQAYVVAAEQGLSYLAEALKAKALELSANTKLDLKHFPFEWDALAREMLPEDVIAKLTEAA
jgi:hypothetical protein